MTWLDLGNHWRNLYLLSCLMQTGALGCLFAARGWFVKENRPACFLTGVASTPLVQYLWTLLLALVWPNAPQMVYIGGLPVLSVLVVLGLLMANIRKIKALVKHGIAFAKRLVHFDKPALIVLCFALCIMLLLLPACVRFMSSMNSINAGGDAGEYMARALRYCEDRDLAPLLEKDEQEGHFRGHSHFPSMELHFSYGLFHADGELGYPYDKPAFTGMGMLIFYAMAAYGALLCSFCRKRKICVLLGVVLFNLVPDLYFSVAGAPRDIWRILAVLWAAAVFCGLTEEGNWKHYLGKLVLTFLVCFTAMSAHVVCFVVLPFIVIAWVLWRFLRHGITQYGGAWKALARSVGMAVSGALGTLLAFSGNLWCFLKWGEMSPWRLMTTFTDAPWYAMYMDNEYKLDETTTHLNFWESWDSILMDYATPIGTCAFWAAVTALVLVIAYLVFVRIGMARKAKVMKSEVRDAQDAGAIGVIIHNRQPGAQTASVLGLCALFTILTLAPMTGVLDSPLYSFSGTFVHMPRYTLQWFLMGCVMVCALLAALAEIWPAVTGRLGKAVWLRQLPAWLCVAVCLFGMVRGLNQTGYTNTFYRYSRGVMEDEEILLDNGFQTCYGLLMRVAAEVPEEQKMLITRDGYQYPLRGRGYVLTSNPIVSIMNEPLENVEAALKDMNVALLATAPEFWDERYYAKSYLSEYLNALPDEQIIETEHMRLYLVDPALVPAAQEIYNEMYPVEGGTL